MKNRSRLLVLCIIVMLFVITSCDVFNAVDEEEGTLNLTIDRSVLQVLSRTESGVSEGGTRAIHLSSIVSIEVTIRGNNIATPLTSTHTLQDTSGSASITISDIPIGVNRAIKVSAIDASGTPIPGYDIYGTIDIMPGENTGTINWGTTPRGRVFWDLIASDQSAGTNFSAIDAADVETFIQQVVSDNSLSATFLVNGAQIASHIIGNSGALPTTTSGFFFTPSEVQITLTGLGSGVSDSQIVVFDPLSLPVSISTDGTYTIQVFPGTWDMEIQFFNQLYALGYEIDATSSPVTTATDAQGAAVDFTSLDVSGTASLSISTGNMSYTPVSDIQFQSYRMYVPQGLVIPTVQPTGDFEGAVIQDTGGDLAAFCAVTPAYGNESDASSVLQSRTNLIDQTASSMSLISQRQNSAGDMITAHYSYTIATPVTVISVNNQLLSLIGASVQGGTIADLPSELPSSGTYTEFRYSITVRYVSSNEIIVLSSITPSSLFSVNEEIVNGIVDGTNLGTQTSTLMTTNDAFSAQGGGNLADFLFVVDNSGSMYDEQTAISAAANEFWSKMSSAGLDFQVGVITTDSQSLRGSGFTTDQSQFQSDVTPGTSGSATERGIYFSELALDSSGSVTAAGHPRNGASMSVIIMSDEQSQYSGSFDVNNNLFVANGYKVYTIIDTGYAGQYDDLANATGGSIASIGDTSQFANIMTSIATDAGGASSQFVLTNTPISSTIAVYVNSVAVPRSNTDGWGYNEASNSIIFYGSSVPSSGATINVAYNWIQ
ncbi:MAG: hypothetical protein AB7D92_10660 [Sphaerochaeta sp.]